jgi:hypothetical protein
MPVPGPQVLQNWPFGGAACGGGGPAALAPQMAQPWPRSAPACRGAGRSAGTLAEVGGLGQLRSFAWGLLPEVAHASGQINGLLLVPTGCRHREWQGGQGLDEELEPAGFPGRVLLLSRAAAGPATMHRDSSDASGAGSSSSSGRADGCDWQAGWVGSSELAGWGVRVTKHAAADHHVSRLLGVLGNLAAAEPGAPRVP